MIVFYDAAHNLLYAEGTQTVWPPRSLTASSGPNGITISTVYGTAVLGPLAPNAIQRQDGTSFADASSALAYLQGEFSVARPIGGVQFFTAAQDVGGHRAMMFTEDGAGAVVYADPTAADYSFAGVSLGAAASGAAVETMTSGLVEEPSWAWTPLAPVYVGAVGALTQAVPTAGFFHLIGVAPSPSSLLVAPGPLVQLA